MTTLRAIVLLACLIAAHPATAQDCPETEAPCLEPNTTGGCENAACCKTICSLDPQCCSEAWDLTCVALADETCTGLCGSSVAGDCQVPHAAPGCRDTECCDAVCAADPTCCSVTWDASCALIAGGACSGGEPVECGLPELGSCIAPHTNPGCEYAFCCKVVCGIDPSCCSQSWDIVCATLGLSYCSGCNVQCPPDTPEAPEACAARLDDPCASAAQEPVQVSPGAGICGALDANEILGPETVDRDVYRITLVDTNGDGVVNLTLRLAASVDAFAALVPTGCPVALPQALHHVNATNCAEVLASRCVPAGTYWIVVAPGAFPSPTTSIVPCLEEPRYTLLAEVSQAGCSSPCTPTAGACNDVHQNPGCNDGACCQAVCAADPFCCTVTWDAGCVLAAATACSFSVPDGNECVDAVPLDIGAAVDFNTANATVGAEPFPATCVGSSSGSIGPDVWFSYDGERRGTVSIDTCGSLIDTRIVVYEGTCEAMNLVACASSSNACPQVSSARLNFTAVCGKKYLIRVGGESTQIAGSCRVRLTANGPVCPAFCPADLNRDGTVDGVDMGIMLGNWGLFGAGDLNFDATVNGQDLGVLLGAWGTCPPTP
jgi:hypothetical protein